MVGSWRQRLKSAFYGVVLGLAIPSLALGETATLLPNAKQQYLDDSGNPVANGQVYYYVPNTTTKKTVWQDSSESTEQDNPVQLDAAGRPLPDGQTYGSGSYRQKVVDQDGLTIWDAVTASTGSGGGTSPAFSEGVMVGTIIPWANTTLPAKYLYTAGQAVSRTTYSDLLTAITYQTSILCQSGIATISVSTTISDSIPVGAALEASCFAPGTVVNSKSSGSLTLSNSATATSSVTAVLFPWGNGNGSTTFNVPDLRGRTLAGRNNMGGSASSVLTSSWYLTCAGAATNPNAVNSAAGCQNSTLTLAQLPTGITAANASQSITVGFGGFGIAIQSSTLGSFNAAAGGSPNIATSAGSWVGATSASGNNSITVTSNNTSGAAHSIVQPTVTADYIIKALPDDTPGGTGVTSIQGMTGAISCTSPVVCTGNAITVVLPSTSVSSVSNSDGTLTVSPVTGDVVASLNLAHANTWTALQTFNNVAGITVTGARYWANSSACSMYAGNSAGNAIISSACGTHSGDINTFVGHGAGANATTDFASTYLGSAAGFASTTAHSNTCLGAQACIGGTTHFENTGVGVDALFSNVTGSRNVAVGHHVASSVVNVDQSVYIGAEANGNGVGASNTTMVGFRAGYKANASAAGSTFVGYLAGFNNTSGSNNTLIGQEAGQAVTTGTDNTLLGYRAGFNLTTGTSNVFVGDGAGFYETTNNSRLYIDNTDRGSLGAAVTSALIYGVFSNTVTSQTLAFNAATGIRNNATTSFTVGPNGTTNPVFQIDSSTASQTAGLKLTGAVDAGTVALLTVSGGTAANLSINAKGSGQLTLNDTASGGVSIGGGGGVITLSTAIRYGGVTLTNAVTGTGRMVLDNTPTLITPVLGVATATSINKVAITAPASSATLTIADGKTLTASNSITVAGTDGKTMTFSNSLTFTGTDASSVAFGTGGTVSYLIATGTKALATSAISSATCTSAQTDTATGATTSSVVDASFASDPTAVTGYTPATTGMLTIISYATSNTVNFKVCNNTNASITPGAISLNWRVRS